MAESKKLSLEYAFFKVLRNYYIHNKGKIRRNYKSLTKKFLDYNDKESNPDAYLRKPQFEALEMYIFIKEFLNNENVSDIFYDWSNRKNRFSDESYYSINGENEQITFLSWKAEDNEVLFKKMKKFQKEYPNYIYALTMGLGKTTLIATCIFYEFLLANKHPKDKRYCHNALIFAPDKTVLQSLKEIVTLDKSLVVPHEYCRLLDSNIKIHFLDDSGVTLNTLDDSDFNIIISNTQKIIVKKRQKEQTSTNILFNMPSKMNDSSISKALKSIYGDDNVKEEGDLILNQRFMKLCRLSQLGIYVDEAHHMFGNELQKSLNGTNTTSLRVTIDLLASELKEKGTGIVGCYNYTGTPYVKNEILPEVVYAYGLKESIANNYLKDVNIKGYENVKNEEFLRTAITEFCKIYSGNLYEGLYPKMAIFGATIDELVSEIKPIVEKVLVELNIPTSKILINTGDTKTTKDKDLFDFNNLDVAGSEGNEKQFILLVNKGREGWNCRSLFSVALYRSPKSKIFVLQATMRCLRKITEEQQTAKIFLSKDNFDILEEELNSNFNMTVKDMKGTGKTKKEVYKVKVVPPLRHITLKNIKHKHELSLKEYSGAINFELSDLDIQKYESRVYEKNGLSINKSIKSKNIDNLKINIEYSEYTLVAEIARYLNEKCILISKILRECIDGIDKVLEVVNKYNDVIYDIIVPKIFYEIYQIKTVNISEDKDVVLLRKPRDSEYYVFHSTPDLVIKNMDEEMQNYNDRSFHTDTYCFDSKPEKECFLQYITSDKVEKVYFTGMFTAKQGDFYVQYYDPESQRIRSYYPDFLAEMKDGTYRIIEVKGDNKIDDEIVKAKADAAKEIATESKMEYKIYKGSKIMNSNILEEEDFENNALAFNI